MLTKIIIRMNNVWYVGRKDVASTAAATGKSCINIVLFFLLWVKLCRACSEFFCSPLPCATSPSKSDLFQAKKLPELHRSQTYQFLMYDNNLFPNKKFRHCFLQWQKINRSRKKRFATINGAVSLFFGIFRALGSQTWLNLECKLFMCVLMSHKTII